MHHLDANFCIKLFFSHLPAVVKVEKNEHSVDQTDANQKLIVELEKKNQSLIGNLKNNEKIVNQLNEVIEHDVLQTAAKNGYNNLFEKVLEKRLDKNPRDKNGVTLLHHAAENGHGYICEFIISVVEDRNPKDIIGKTII